MVLKGFWERGNEGYAVLLKLQETEDSTNFPYKVTAWSECELATTRFQAGHPTTALDIPPTCDE